MVDPSLFTLPYDAALVAALAEAGVTATLIGRPLRPGEAAPGVDSAVRFYRRFDAHPWLKAAEHLLDGLGLALERGAPRLLHVQWLPLPLADAALLRLARRRGPVVVTVHDTVPFNGSPTAGLQARGFVAALRAADRLIVHTGTGRGRLVAMGLEPRRIRVVPHGPLPAPALAGQGGRGRYTLVAFGKMRPYKGLDLLVEAVAALPEAQRRALRVILAGEPLMDVAPLAAQVGAAGLAGTVEIVPRRLDAGEIGALFGAADAFVFPYREIEASGVFHMVAGLSRWIVASRLGAFAEAVEDGFSGRLVAPADVSALAAALAECATCRPRPTAAARVTGWAEIARQTIDVYAEAWRAWASPRAEHEVTR